jgi:hypothetical protein
VIQCIGSTFISVLLGGGLAWVFVTTLPGKCSRTIVARDSSGEVHRDPSGFLTSPSLQGGFALCCLEPYPISPVVIATLLSLFGCMPTSSVLEGNVAVVRPRRNV